jgi:hypothetical protein
MSIWLERKTDPTKPATHVLVVGVSRYDKLPENKDADPPDGVTTTFGLVQVQSPALSAFKFARWLRDTYHNPGAPLASIRLLLSPSAIEKTAEPELKAACSNDETVDRGDRGVETRPLLAATTDNVEKAHDEWVDACRQNKGNVAILYASGHGICITHEDSYVLLQDFAVQKKPIRASLDIAGFKKGLVGPKMAQTQFYFVDACRVPAENLGQMPNPGDGICPNERWTGPDERSLEIFFSATSWQEAIARRGMPTLFNQALIETLDGSSWVKSASGEFVVTPALMLESLKTKVRDLSKRRQKVAHSDQGETHAFHIFPAPPRITVQVALNPPDGASSALARLRAGNGRCLREKQVFDPHPLVLTDLEPAIYTLDIDFNPVTPPYSPLNGFVIRAENVPVPLHTVEFP